MDLWHIYYTYLNWRTLAFCLKACFGVLLFVNCVSTGVQGLLIGHNASRNLFGQRSCESSALKVAHQSRKIHFDDCRKLMDYEAGVMVNIEALKVVQEQVCCL